MGSRPASLNRYYDNDIPDTVENRNYQIKIITEALKCIAVQQLYVEDCEADDVIGYMCRYMFTDDKIVIVSSDKDMYQLISDRVTQWSPGQKKFIDSHTVKKKFGVLPVNMCAVRCFVGDPSDALEGVRGAGFKTMVKRFPALQGEDPVLIQDILDDARSRMSESVKLYRNIVEQGDIVKRNWKLMHLDTANLSATQIKKIRTFAENHNSQRNKMNLLRIFVKEGVQNFDVDSFFMSLNSLMRTHAA